MKIVIIGGVAAGAKAAAKSKRMLPDSDIHIYTKDTHVSYSACGLPYYIEGNFEDWQKLIVRSKEEFEKSGIHVHTLNQVTKILSIDKKIMVKNLETGELSFVNYDKLVIATGSIPYLPELPKDNLKNIFTLKTLHDGIAIKSVMQKVNNITVIGGGYIGIELIEAFVKNGKNVTLIERSPFILSVFDEDISSLIQNYILENSNNQVKIITDDVISEFIGEEKVSGVLTSKGSGFETEMVVLAAGVRPVVEIAKDAGIDLGITGAIKVNSRMETNIPDIYACGDCAEKTFLIDGSKVWIPLGSTANKEGRAAAVNLAGGDEDFEGVLGSAVVRCLSLTMSMTGYTEKKASQAGFQPVSVSVTKYDRVGYMPDVNNITLKLIADKTTGLLLGGQAIGAGDADKRINALTGALIGRLTVEEFTKNDLTYAPPFSPTIDPLLNAAQLLLEKIRKD